MTRKAEYKNISADTKRLLNDGENQFCDYKREYKAIHSEDLVAFANTDSGGTILIGIEEYSQNGLQKGRVYGQVNIDETKNFIMNKASYCIPQVHIIFCVENTSKTPFLRVDIPSGKEKPYCTQSGKYKIRVDGSNRRLTPNQLLNMFLENESKRFVQNFSEATSQLEDKMVGLNAKFSSKVQQLSKQLDSLSSKTESKLQQVFKTADLVAKMFNKATDGSQENHILLTVIKKELEEFIQERFKHFTESFDAFTKDECTVKPKLTYQKFKEQTFTTLNFLRETTSIEKALKIVQKDTHKLTKTKQAWLAKAIKEYISA